MADRRLFGTVVRISDDRSAMVHRADDRGDVRISAKEVAAAGGLEFGDVVEFRLWPNHMAGDALLIRRGRHLQAQAAE